jgi:hypothetical protein
MVGPLARITPTQLPWGWTLAAMWIVLATLSPALAAETKTAVDSLGDAVAATERATSTGWRLVPLEQTLRRLQQRDPATSRLLPLAMLPMPRSTWWLGLGASRTSSARVELRWTMPLDGMSPTTYE